MGKKKRRKAPYKIPTMKVKLTVGQAQFLRQLLSNATVWTDYPETRRVANVIRVKLARAPADADPSIFGRQ